MIFDENKQFVATAVGMAGSVIIVIIMIIIESPVSVVIGLPLAIIGLTTHIWHPMITRMLGR